ncbi:WD40-repeat-containing domain protein [Polychytrium aggregatum]|uniref:WD40-repeat-containing domain protein n=1 Tax=Polychytrium aggregatum TaxID=110093 RepID=UPI0022FDBD1B|nr:WD40-repeat-containing domain protein [Polychytrium aggregatum]KAI9204433.1 WD40-repeat-containing domain protein [Polychytrium aggregatum]
MDVDMELPTATSRKAKGRKPAREAKSAQPTPKTSKAPKAATTTPISTPSSAAHARSTAAASPTVASNAMGTPKSEKRAKTLSKETAKSQDSIATLVDPDSEHDVVAPASHGGTPQSIKGPKTAKGHANAKSNASSASRKAADTPTKTATAPSASPAGSGPRPNGAETPKGPEGKTKKTKPTQISDARSVAKANSAAGPDHRPQSSAASTATPTKKSGSSSLANGQAAHSKVQAPGTPKQQTIRKDDAAALTAPEQGTAPSGDATSAESKKAKKSKVARSFKVNENVPQRDALTSAVKKGERFSANVSTLTCGNLGAIPPVFTKDSGYLFCATESTIKIFSVATGHAVRSIVGHTDTVTATFLNPENHLQLYSGSLDGTIRLWDFNDAILLKSWNIGEPIQHMCVSKAEPSFLFVAIQNPGQNSSSVLKFNVAQKTVKWEVIMTLKGTIFRIEVDPSGEYLVAGSTSQRFKVLHLPTKTQEIYSLDGVELSTFAIHPTEPAVAVGDSDGQITLWYCLRTPFVAAPVTTTLHWHAHRVNGISFTADGAYMLSGGEEAVLVVWQLETRNKQFLPRLNSEIVSVTVSPTGSLFALGHRDNSIRIISSVNLTVRQAVAGLKIAQENRELYPLSTGLVVEPRENAVCLNGSPGTLQFYNPFADRHVMELEITSGNRVSRQEDREIIRPHVVHAAFSKTGDWMTTVDTRDDGEFDPELYLKFWTFDHNSRSYAVNTRVDNPHDGAIHGLAFRQASSEPLLAVTCGNDKKFKIWQLNTAHSDDDEKEETYWSCRSVGFYKESAISHVTFSEDGSILAVACENDLTLWNPLTNALHAVLTYPPPTNTIRNICFTSGSEPYVVAVTDTHIHVWNLLTCTIWWSVRVGDVAHCASDPKSAHFAVVLTGSSDYKSKIAVFHPSSPVSVHNWNVDEDIVSLTFFARADNTARSNSGMSVLILNNKYQLQLVSGEQLGGSDEASQEQEQGQQEQIRESIAPSLFSSIYGKAAVTEPETQSFATAATKSAENYAESTPYLEAAARVHKTVAFLESPSHVLPPPTKLITAFFEHLLEQMGATQIQDDDQALDADGDVVVVPDGDENHMIIDTDPDQALVSAKIELGFMKELFQSQFGAETGKK